MVNNDKYGFFYELADMPYDCCTYLTNTRTQSSPDGSVVRAAERVKSSFYTSAPTRLAKAWKWFKRCSYSGPPNVLSLSATLLTLSQAHLVITEQEGTTHQ
ncbi:hypothetical protein Y032_0010g922 [Ancylostoma ceylanicum]|uniref:Uncharacterized protein n=1 Tax=Ancylostoma ceylanicum TaxID=53326 RepID=A0A016VIW7_9BILA|nr:hypothetical protein Y032_0010g922 [Ancylostoma ceylanicum]